MHTRNDYSWTQRRRLDCVRAILNLTEAFGPASPVTPYLYRLANRIDPTTVTR
jgi:hypothetical protein